MSLNLSISIGALQTQLNTDLDLSFDAIESILSRAVKSTLDAYMSLPPEERERVMFDASEDDDEDDD
jgi:hypothetical protein